MKKILFLILTTFVVSGSYLLAYSEWDIIYAQYLAHESIVTSRDRIADFRLDDTILRQEVIGMALKLKGVSFSKDYNCKQYYTDVMDNDWVCGALELAADIGMITRENTQARPQDRVTRSEALAILLKAEKIVLSKPRMVSQNDGTTWTLYEDLKWLGFTQWQANMLDSLPSCNIIFHGELCEDGADMNTVFAQFWPNTVALRSEVFEYAALLSGYDPLDEVTSILNDLDVLLQIEERA